MDRQTKSYAPPAVTVVGTVASVTQGQHRPLASLDATFPSGTPGSQLTYS